MAKANNVIHFAIHADNLERAQKFYGKVFGWQFEGFGGGPTTEFCKMTSPNGDELTPIGAMQSRKFNVASKDVIGFECSIGVKDVDATAIAVEVAGGKILMLKTAIPGVGWLIKFTDTEGNLACAVRFDASAK